MADLTGRNADETKPDIATWGTGNVLETGEGTVKVDLDDKASLSDLEDKASLSLNQGYVSEYSARVYQEGGTIQNGRRTAAPFISDTYEDAKMILNASGGLDIEEVDGRKVVNKMWDSSQEKENQEFAGSDRPEFHKTLDGVEQVCVERETTNEVTNPNDFTAASWIASSVTLTTSQSSPSNSDATKWEADTDDSNTLLQDFTLSVDTNYTFSIYAKKDNVSHLFLRGNFNGSSQDNIGFDLESGAVSGGSSTNQSNAAVKNIGGGWYRCSITFTAFSGDSNAIRVQVRFMDGPPSSGGNDSNSTGSAGIIWRSQLEEGNYPTLWVEGTRPAPSPVIEDALPETGTVAGVVDMLMNQSNFDDIFDSGSLGGSTSTTRSRLTINGSNEILSRVFGSDGGGIGTITFPFSYNDNERSTFAYLLTYNSSEISLFLLWADTKEIKKLSSSHQINDTSIKDVGLADGRQSQRFENPWYKDQIVRVNATDDEIKAFFEDLVKGTSMEISTSEMTIVE